MSSPESGLICAEETGVMTSLFSSGRKTSHMSTTMVQPQLVLPKSFHQLIYRELHEEMGHLGAKRTLSLIRDRFYWPHMQREVDHYVTNVCSCLKRKHPNKPTRAPLVNVVTTYPFEMVSVQPCGHRSFHVLRPGICMYQQVSKNHS